ADDPELQLALGDLLDDAVRVRDRQRHRELRMFALELAEQDGHDRASGPRRGAERELAAQRTVLTGKLVEQLPLDREHPLRGPVEPLPGLGRFHAPTRAVEQLGPESVLERPNLKADCGLRDPEPLSCLGEALAVDYLAERGKLARVHKYSL